MPITLPEQTTKDVVHSLQRYFHEELDQEIGDLRAQMLLDFILIEIAPSVYNRAISDAQKYFQERTLDLDGSCYEPELTYWTPKADRPRRQ